MPPTNNINGKQPRKHTYGADKEDRMICPYAKLLPITVTRYPYRLKGTCDQSSV